MKVKNFVIPWVLQSFAYFTSVVAAPSPNRHGLEARAPPGPPSSWPGIGVELEVRQFKLRNQNENAKNAGEDMIAAVKGAVLIPHGERKSGTCYAAWALTAEHGGNEPESGISDLTFEWIVDGKWLKLKPGKDDLVLPGVWDSLSYHLERLNPHKGDKFSITGVDSTRYGDWTLDEPTSFSINSFLPGIQVTTALPMAGIYDLIDMAASGKDNVLLPTLRAKKERLVLVEEKDLKDYYTDDSTIDAGTLGFYSLLMSYVKIATQMNEANRDGGPKQLLNIMPRTDWNKLYDLYGRDHDADDSKKRCKKKKKDPNQKLLDIVKDLGKKKNLGDVESATFKWSKATRSQVTTYPGISTQCGDQPPETQTRMLAKRAGVDENTQWPSRNSDIGNKELSVKTWIEELDNGKDVLSVMDKVVWDGQIGGLGDRTEGPLTDTSDETELGLFELRDIASFTPGSEAVKDKLTKIEKQVKAWHEGSSSSLRKRAGLFCKRPESGDPKCEGTQAPNAQGKCEDCGRGYKPNVGNTKCIPENPEDDEKKKKGKCKDKDFILDPAQGGQDENTENPVCTYDDDKKCKAKGQTAVTRSPNNKVEPKDGDAYQPVCGKDNDPNFRCRDKNTYHHKDIDSDDNIKHSCRSTRDAKKQQKEKYQPRVEKAKEQKEKTKETRKKENRERSRRTRMGFCFTLLAGLSAWDMAEIEGMPEDDMNGMMELWPEDDKFKEADPVYIADYKAKITPPVTVQIPAIAAAGVPFVGLATALTRIVAPLTRATGATKVFTLLRTGGRARAADGAVKAAKGSGTVGKILKDQRFLDCLAAVPAIAANRGKTRRQDNGITTIRVNGDTITLDPNAPFYDPKIAPPEFDNRQIIVKGMIDTDGIMNNVDPSAFAATYPDKIRRPGRLEYETCQQLPDELKNTVTAIAVEGGCCAWYADSDCKQSSWLFAMTNRSDYQLDGKHNDNAEAIWCTFDSLCSAAPGRPESG